jgi:RNA polymerase sigma-70 factor (ECF subfamily)
LTTPDLQLLEQAREYDDQALAEIYDRYAEAIYRYLYRILGDPAQAEDLTGEVFLRLLRVLPTSRAPRDNLRGWLYRVAHNLAMDWFRRNPKGRTVAWEAGTVPGEGVVATGESPAAVLERRQTREQLWQAIQQLTRAQQRVVVLRFGEGFKIAEVARLMGKGEGAVKVLQHRAIRRLRALLNREERQADEGA